ncbi:MAG: hypothetical protein Q7S04_01720 [Candidatus Moranbacteria bacterium]|nr:hypothetical protein [Candidatus Moranbacteria bacterium]
MARCVTPGAGYSSNSYCCQDKAAATPPAGGVPASSPTPGGVPAPTGSQSISFTNPLLFNTVEGLLGSLLGTLQGIIVVLALVFIVIGAVLYVTSAGNEGQMTLAKGAITAAMIGLALGIAAPSFLKEISGILGWTPAITCPTAVSATVTADDIAKCTAAQATLAAGKPLSEIALNVLNFLLSIVGVLTVIMMVVGGVIYLTAAGNEDQIDTGKKIVNYATIGILVSLASLILVRQIASFFG